jgi:hypothetical protein
VAAAVTLGEKAKRGAETGEGVHERLERRARGLGANRFGIPWRARRFFSGAMKEVRASGE